MPTYKHTYFDVKGRGEPIRLLFALAGQDFEDVRIKISDWPEIKPTTPQGSLPILEVDGKVFVQSLAIARFLARKFGMYGDSDMDQAKGDMVVDFLSDTFKDLAKLYFAKEDKEEKVKTYKEEKLDKDLSTYEKYLNDSGYFLGNKVSWADIEVFTCIESWYPQLGYEIDGSKYPKLTKMMKNMNSNLKVAQYLKDRPVTDF